MRLSIRHTSRYRFDQPVVFGLQRLRLTPKASGGQAVASWSIMCTGATQELSYQDSHHNEVTLVSVNEGAREVVITCEGQVDTRDESGVIGWHSGYMPLWSFLRQTPLTRPGPAMTALADAARGRDTGDQVALLHDLSALVRERVVWRKGVTTTRTTGEEACAGGAGVCQDQAHVFIGVARALSIPARYVSGYLLMTDRVDQEATHGWAEAFIDGLGWVGFDIANAISPDARYVRLATGGDYRDAAPVLGVSYGAVTDEAEVAVRVERAMRAQQQKEQQQ
ncbi:transglutaminase family protein [Erythrobacteraceae bacterium CFH 75059]|uniref:transglutaminase family protein n=1 Tax=Qipengyuania thermophila TaxID=2509361 RepID=UPI00102179AD|nr:transglutaminase family protein [Qipengyuania thermophila]TCD06364.1 transglutaminase family protein [Erythrobacteraceae bacterium CFH 75059]